MTQPIVLWCLKWGKIERVECIKVTACYVWPAALGSSGGRGVVGASDRHIYYETWEEAHQAALALAENELAISYRQLERAQDDCDRIKGMKPPADAEVQP